MHTFSRHIHIDAPPEVVWHTLADIGSIHVWNPGVRDSHATSEEPTGLGATRRCDLGGRTYLDERVVGWEPMRRLTMRIEDTNLPFAHADIRFTLEPEGKGTRVGVSPEYRLRYGPLGALTDRLFVRRTYARGMDALLAGLKAHVETDHAAA